MARWGGAKGKEVWLEEEEGMKGDGEELKPALAGRVRHDVMRKPILIY